MKKKTRQIEAAGAAGLKLRLPLIAAAAFAALAAAAVFYFTLFPAYGTFFADCTDTLYWAQASYESGRLIDPGFCYATLLPFGASLLMLPLIPFFGLSMTTQMLGMALFAAVFMGALWFFAGSLGLSLPRRLCFFGAVLLVLSASAKLREMMWEHTIYYSLGILFALLMLGLLFRMQAAHTAGKRRCVWVLAGLLWVLGVLVGTDGVQVLVFCTIPIAGALVAERFFDLKTHLFDKENRPAYLAAAGLLLTALAGLLLLAVLRGPVRTYYDEAYYSFAGPDAWMDRARDLPQFWATLLGFSAAQDDKLFSLSALPQFVRLAGALVLAVVPVVALARYRAIQSRRLRVLLWYHLLLALFILASNILGRTGTVNWRLMPLVFSSAVVTLLWLQEVWPRAGQWRRVLALPLAALAVFCLVSAASMLRFAPGYNRDNEYTRRVQLLEEHGLAYGYADFWVGNPVTVYSGGAVQVRNATIDDAGVRANYYQTRLDWYEDQAGVDRYFVLTDPDGGEKLRQSAQWPALEETLVEEIDGGDFIVLVFSENPVVP